MFVYGKELHILSTQVHYNFLSSVLKKSPVAFVLKNVELFSHTLQIKTKSIKGRGFCYPAQCARVRQLTVRCRLQQHPYNLNILGSTLAAKVLTI